MFGYLGFDKILMNPDSVDGHVAQPSARLLRNQAVAAGWRNGAHMNRDHDLNILRDRDDFKKLLAGLEKKAETKK